MKRKFSLYFILGLVLFLMSIVIYASADDFKIEVPGEIRVGEDLTIKWKSVDLANSYSLDVFCYDQSIDLEWEPNVWISFGDDSEDRSWTFYGYEHTLVPGKYYVRASAGNDNIGLHVETTADFIVKSAVRSEPPKVTSNQSSFNLGDQIIFSIDTNGAEKWICMDRDGFGKSGKSVTETPTIWKTTADGKHSNIYQFAVRKNGVWSKVAYIELDFSFVQGPYKHLLIQHERIEPSCTEEGLEAYWSCKACGKLFSDEKATTEIEKPVTIAAKGHTEVVDAAVDPTCTEEGLTEGSHCSVCGTVLTAQKAVAAKGHTSVTDAAVAATCTEHGLTEGSHCSVCNTVLKAQEKVPALGHKEVIDKAIPATTESTGLTEGKHCERCGTVLVAQQVIPKLEPQTPEEKVKAFVIRCYQVILGRGVDPEGLANWSAALLNGTAQASQIIDGIVSSQEYALKNLNHEASVKVLYQAMLGRDPDPAGLAAWTKVLDDGYPFGSVINGFCGSPEFIAICNSYGIQPGSVNVGPVIPKPADDTTRGLIEGFVKRCYVILLDRGVDPTGLKDWSDALENGVAQASQIIDGIVNSQEFQLRGLTNEQKVDCLYMAMLGRGADPDGKAAWVQVLADGHPYAAVINGFCGSIEFGNICAEYRIQPGSVAVKGVLVKREAITPEGDEPEAPVVYKGYNSEYINEEKVRAFVEHCYESVLGRQGDEEGIEAYTKLILDGKKTPKKVAYEFVFSTEFQNQLPGNEEFIRIMYKLYLNREPGAEELAGWLEMLESGTGLEEIVKGFAESAEFRTIVNGMKD